MGAACLPLGKLALIMEKRSWNGAELVFVRTSQGSHGAVKAGLYFNLVREMDLSPRREGPRTGGNQAPKLCSTFGDNHGSLVGEAADPLLG